MVCRTVGGVVALACLLGGSVSAQQIPRMPEGVGVGTAGYGIVDSTHMQYSNSGTEKNKLEAEGFGPLYGAINSGALGPLIDLLAGGPYTGNPIFNNVKLRTRGEVYGIGYSHGVDEKVTFDMRWRFGNLRTKIYGKDTPDFARISQLVTLSGGEPVDDAHMNDRLIDADFSLAFWMDEQEVGDSSMAQTAIIAGYTHRNSWDTGQDLVKFALTELARMNRPGYLRLGFQSKITDLDGGLGLEYGMQANYHPEGDTQNANTAILINNTQLSVGALTGFPTGGAGPVRKPVEDVRSAAHWGASAHFLVTSDAGPLDLGAGVYYQYENDHGFRRIQRTGNPVADASIISERPSEDRGFWRFMLAWNTFDEYQRGETDLPFNLSLQIDDSFFGRNLSELQIATVRFSLPLMGGS